MDAWHSFQPLPKLTLGHSKKNATKRQPMEPLLWPASNQRIRGYFRWTWRGVEGDKVIAASIAAIPRSLASREIQFNGRTCGKNPRGRGPDLSIHIVVEEFLIWIREGCVLILEYAMQKIYATAWKFEVFADRYATVLLVR